MTSGRHHHHDTGGMSDARLVWAVIVNVGLTIAQIIGGVLSGSLALIADVSTGPVLAVDLIDAPSTAT